MLKQTQNMGLWCLTIKFSIWERWRQYPPSVVHWWWYSFVRVNIYTLFGSLFKVEPSFVVLICECLKCKLSTLWVILNTLSLTPNLFRQSSTGNAQLKLVATDYNSDDQNTSPGDSSFASTAIVRQRHTRKRSSKNPSPLLELPTVDTPPIVTRTKPPPKTSFASIITGGRSPEHIVAPTGDDAANASHLNDVEEVAVAPVVKMQKRKRRIEFITKAPENNIAELDISSPVQVTPEPIVHIPDVQQHSNEPADNTTTANCPTFKAASDELVDTSSVQAEGDIKVARLELDSLRDGQLSAVTDLKDTIGAKLKFLCDGRPEVPAVQAIMIQMEVSNYIAYI